jgi:trigger factor
VKVRVPEDDPREELRGKELDLEVTLKEVKHYVLPAIDAEFLKANDYDDEAEMREDVRKRILRAKRREVERTAEETLVEQLLGSVPMALPPEFVERELASWTERRRAAAEAEGVSEEEAGKIIEAGRADAQQRIEQDMRRFFLLDRIAEAEGVDATQEEMVSAIQEIAQAYGHPVEEVVASFRDQGRLSELRAQIRHRKVREMIRTAATLVEQAPEAPAAPPAEAESKPAKGGKKK